MRNSTPSHTVTETAPKAALLMLSSGLFLLVISALLIIGTRSPATLSRPIATASLLTGAFSGGFFVSNRLTASQAYLASCIAGATVATTLFLVKLLFPSGSDLTPMISLLLHSSIVAISVFGTFVGLRRSVHHRKKRKKHLRS